MSISSSISRIGRTGTELSDYFVKVFRLDRVDDKVALPRDEVSIPHSCETRPCSHACRQLRPADRERVSAPLQSSASFSYFDGRSQTLILEGVEISSSRYAHGGRAPHARGTRPTSSILPSPIGPRTSCPSLPFQ
jgi:hypothetical protein